MRDIEGIGIRIRGKRATRKMSQNELAEKCRVSPVTISMIERGKRFPSIDLLVQIAESLQTTTDSLLTPSNQQTTEDIIKNIVERLEKTANEDELVHFLDQLSSLLVRYFSK